MDKPLFQSTDFDEGMSLYKQGRVSQALTRFMTAASQQPDWPQAQHNVANCLRALGRNKEAISAYRKVLLINPRFAASLNDLAVALDKAGELDEALALREKVVEYTVKGREYAYLNYGNSLARSGRVEEAIESYRASIAINPGYATAHHNLGKRFDEQGRFEEASDCYRQALRCDSEDIDALRSLAYSLSKLKRTDEAIPVWEDFLKRQPRNSSAITSLAACVLVRAIETDSPHMLSRCLALLRKALWLNPRNIGAWFLLREYLTTDKNHPGIHKQNTADNETQDLSA